VKPAEAEEGTCPFSTMPGRSPAGVESSKDPSDDTLPVRTIKYPEITARFEQLKLKSPYAEPSLPENPREMARN
jgi:hypothetical protein